MTLNSQAFSPAILQVRFRIRTWNLRVLSSGPKNSYVGTLYLSREMAQVSVFVDGVLVHTSDVKFANVVMRYDSGDECVVGSQSCNVYSCVLNNYCHNL